jgi:hypothetical protein
MSWAEQVAKALGGMPTRDGGWLCPCPLPSHGKGRGDRNPSLSVADGEKGLLVNCFGGCAPIDVLAELRGRRLLADFGPSDRRPSRPIARPAEHAPDPEAVTRWRAAKRCPDRAVVGRYIAQVRGISLDPPPTIRQGTALRCGRVPLPTMIAAVQRPDGQVVAVQETFLTWNATKAPLSCPRLTTGALGEGAVRLAPAEEALGIAEGVETALAAMELSGIPCWASLGAQRLARVWLPEIVRTVYVFADNDEPGRKAATQAADRYATQGRRVLIRRPPAGLNDWNDALRAEVSA